MSIIDYLQQGGKASAKDIITGLANILGIQLEEMAQLWEAGVQKYGSEEALSDALDIAVEGIEDPQSPEFKDAVASVFTEETQLYKQGGKLDQLVSRFAKGGNVDCGCGGKKLKCGGKPKKKEEGGIVKAQEGIALTRRQARDLAKLNKGFNNQQFGVGYTNAKAMLRNNTDLKGKELRNQARLIVSGIEDTTAPVIVETPKAIETPALTTPKEIVIKSLVKPEKSDEQLAMEVLRGLHGNGAARRVSLGDRADAVQAIVNRTIASQRPLTSYGGEITPSIIVAERTTRGPRLKWKDSEGYHIVNSTPKIVETGRDEEGKWYTVSNGRHGYDENGNYYVAEDLPGTMSRAEAMERASNLYAVPLYDKCGGKVEKHQQTNGKGRGKLDTSIYSEYTDKDGKIRTFYDPNGGYAGYVDLTTGKAYRAGDNVEILQPGLYNGKGWPISDINDTKGVSYDVNTNGYITLNLSEGGQRPVTGLDSLAVSNLVKQWDQTKVGHAVAGKQSGGSIWNRVSKPRETYTDGYGIEREVNEPKAITFGRKVYTATNNFLNGRDSNLTDEEYVAKHGYSKPIGEIGIAGMVNPEKSILLGSKLAKRIPTESIKINLKNVTPLENNKGLMLIDGIPHQIDYNIDKVYTISGDLAKYLKNTRFTKLNWKPSATAVGAGLAGSAVGSYLMSDK